MHPNIVCFACILDLYIKFLKANNCCFQTKWCFSSSRRDIVRNCKNQNLFEYNATVRLLSKTNCIRQDI